MDLKSKKGMTLVEMIVSIALIALVSMALLGIMLPTVNMEKDSKKTNTTTYEISGELDRALYDAKNGGAISDFEYIVEQRHILSYTLNGEDYSYDGTLIRAQKPGEDLEMYAFAPVPVTGG